MGCGGVMSSNFLIKVLTYNLLNGQLYTVGAILLFCFLLSLNLFSLEICNWDCPIHSACNMILI